MHSKKELHFLLTPEPSWPVQLRLGTPEGAGEVAVPLLRVQTAPICTASQQLFQLKEQSRMSPRRRQKQYLLWLWLLQYDLSFHWAGLKHKGGCATSSDKAEVLYYVACTATSGMQALPALLRNDWTAEESTSDTRKWNSND